MKDICKASALVLRLVNIASHWLCSALCTAVHCSEREYAGGVTWRPDCQCPCSPWRTWCGRWSPGRTGHTSSLGYGQTWPQPGDVTDLYLARKMRLKGHAAWRVAMIIGEVTYSHRKSIVSSICFLENLYQVKIAELKQRNYVTGLQKNRSGNVDSMCLNIEEGPE